ncbi:MAG: FAD-dependent oxidoreductase, partial [Cyclobacteriaceae bacterium]
MIKALENSRFLYKHLGKLFIRRPIHSLKTFISKEAFSSYLNILKLDFFRSMNKANEGLFNSEKVVQLFNRYATYNGSDPYKTPATMNIIPHLEFNEGAYFPQKGMHDITMSLYGLAQRKGVKFRFNQKVTRIVVDQKRAIGLEAGDNVMHYDAIVSNMDVVNTYRKLIPDEKQPDFLLNQPKSSSALIFYWGISNRFPELELHNIFFSKNYREEFDHIFNKGTIYDDPTVYINITSKHKSDDAPAGCENWFTMINVPNNNGQDWETLINTARSNILKKLSGILGCDISQLIECEEILDPLKIESKTSSSKGALYGNSSNNKYAAFLRHANFSRKVGG